MIIIIICVVARSIASCGESKEKCRELQMENPLHALLGMTIMIPGDPTVSGFKLLEETFEMLIANRWFEKLLDLSF